MQLVNVWPQSHAGIGPGELKYRFAWTFPILFSPHDSSVLYTAGNVVFKSADEGHTWEPISPDLSRNDASKLGPSGGPITKDTSGAEHYCTVATLRECPLEPGVLCAGSDDGLVHLTRDGGVTWSEVTPPDLPEWAFIRTVEPSPHQAGKVYVAATRYKLDDNAPYLYKTTDYGQTWESIVGEGDTAIPADDFVRVIRADPNRPDLLFVGTETSLYLSTDDGAEWDRWDSNLPVTPIYDLTVKGADLVIATHGRSFWILDDLSPIYRLMDDPRGRERLFVPGEVWRILPNHWEFWQTTAGKDYWVSPGKAATFWAEPDETGQVRRTYPYAGASGPRGVAVTYVLGEEATADGFSVALEFLDGDGDLVNRFEPEHPGRDEMDADEKALHAGPWITTKPGYNRFVWDLRYPGSTKVLGNDRGGEADVGPLVVPGAYQARLVIVGPSRKARTLTESFRVRNDPRSDVSQEDLEEQLAALLGIRDRISRAHEAVATIRDIKRQIGLWRERSDLGKEAGAAASRLEEQLYEIEDKLMLPIEKKGAPAPNEPARLCERLASVLSVIRSADTKPTRSSLQVAAMHSAEIEDELADLGDLLATELLEFNALTDNAGLPAVKT